MKKEFNVPGAIFLTSTIYWITLLIFYRDVWIIPFFVLSVYATVYFYRNFEEME